MLIILLWRSKYHLRSRERRGAEKRRGRPSKEPAGASRSRQKEDRQRPAPGAPGRAARGTVYGLRAAFNKFTAVVIHSLISLVKKSRRGAKG
jgi:hypothetical protein